MHIENNLDYEISIVEQLDDYACACNKAHPKEEDFNYKYKDLKQDQKDAIWGAAMIMDRLQNIELEIDDDNDNDSEQLGKIKAEIKTKFINEIFNDLISEIDMMIVSFGDDNACD